MKFQTTNTSVVVRFWVNSMLVFEVVLYCLDLRNGCKKKMRMLGFQRKYCQNFVKNPCSCFSNRLSYNYPN